VIENGNAITLTLQDQGYDFLYRRIILYDYDMSYFVHNSKIALQKRSTMLLIII